MAERRQRRLAQLAHWVTTFWWCRCTYTNVAAYRCYACGARPPRRLRAQAASTLRRKEPRGA